MQETGTNNYTVVEAYEDIRVSDINTEQVILRLRSGRTGALIDVKIELQAFDDMTDREVESAIRKACHWYSRKQNGTDLFHGRESRDREVRLASLLDSEVML